MPKVSIVVPSKNEEATITQLLEGITRQTYPLEDLEVVISDAMSTDQTRQKILHFQSNHPSLEISLLENADQTIPSGLNKAIRGSKGDIIVRLDAHSQPSEDYVERSIEVLETTGAANVGGMWEIEPSSEHWRARSIAAAAAHPIGAGDARYRIDGEQGEVDTVPFGTFDRSWLEKVGLFDESLLTNEDYELNLRLRNAGGKIWFDPSIRSQYFARADFRSLSGQYARYGYWKAAVARQNLLSLKLRQILPPLFVLAFVCLTLAAPFVLQARWLLALQCGVYAAALLVAALQISAKRKDAALILGVPIAFSVMHFSWGGAFLAGFAASLFGFHQRGR